MENNITTLGYFNLMLTILNTQVHNWVMGATPMHYRLLSLCGGGGGGGEQGEQSHNFVNVLDQVWLDPDPNKWA